MPLDKNNSRNVHLLAVTDQQSEFKLGRGHESQVRINDISVSRCHAIIKCKPDGFYIEDNTSKFGTIILLKDKLRLKAHHTMAVQVGRTVISFTIKYVQSERDKLKNDVCKVLDSKSKMIKPIGLNLMAPNKPQEPPVMNLDPAAMAMQATNYQPNMPMLPPQGDNLDYQDVLNDEEGLDAPDEGNMEQS